MRTKCPNCGAIHSLDSLLNSTKAGQAFLVALDVPPALKHDIIQYLGLFRSENRELTFDKAAKLLAELTPKINAGQLTFKHHTTPAPVQAWGWAMQQAVKARNDGKLIIPLKNHNWLYAVLQTYNPNQHRPDEVHDVAKKAESIVLNGQYKPVFTGKSKQETYQIVKERWNAGETTDETYDRIAKEYM